MAGILNSKVRIMDIIITQEGKKQMASGGFVPEFISFTDRSAFYESSISGSSDASSRIYFEATNLPYDLITLESDDSETMLGFNSAPQQTLLGNKIFTTETSGAQNVLLETSGSKFASMSSLLVTASINNFKNQYMLGTRDNPDDVIGDGFTLSKKNAYFQITNSSPFGKGPNECNINLNAIEPLFLDKRLAHLPNFKFLPPITKSGEALAIGANAYQDLNEGEILKYEDLIDELGKTWSAASDEYSKALDPFNTETKEFMLSENFNEESLEIAKPRVVINFDETSLQSNIIAQVFEANDKNSTFQKLDIIDFGVFYDKESPARPGKHVFFVGKVYLDDNSMPTFVSLFTIIMD